jgi:transcription elongation GreA/GreB family factor
MSFTELIQELHKLSPDELEAVQREIDEVRQAKDIEETPELLAAIDEGIRSAREEPLITLEELREEMRTWLTDSK